MLFAEFKERSDQRFTCHISYLEIYNEQVRLIISSQTSRDPLKLVLSWKDGCNEILLQR